MAILFYSILKDVSIDTFLERYFSKQMLHGPISKQDTGATFKCNVYIFSQTFLPIPVSRGSDSESESWF